ncbi:hypothetical protein SNE40_004651 [Patella caerulea]|uniref:Lipase domain-containing protein n=1 Tax=Patella caerulea TaxID=87958 RepID=A0AAN8Q180_PATCE
MFRVVFIFGLCLVSQALIFGSKETCYQPYGCFSNARPFNNAKSNLPDSPQHQQISFHLYTRQSGHSYQTIREHDHSSIKNSHFKHNVKTVFIIHGFTSNGLVDWLVTMASEILKHEDVNVIGVDWEKGAAHVNYFKAVANTRVVGAVTAQLIKDLKSVGGISYSKVHVIGHSLGSHIAGYIGEIIPGLGRITGLDPAGLSFENYDVKVRLDPSDATYVDVIHSDAGTLFTLAFGLAKAIGDTDFYPNGGRNQPGCPHVGNHALDLVTGQIDSVTSKVGCSHHRAIDYFTESINGGCVFTSHPCSSESQFNGGHCKSCGHGCAVMGYHTQSHHPHGTFYLTTKSQHPFCTQSRRSLRRGIENFFIQ